MRLASPVYNHVPLFYFSFTMSDSTTDECFILPPVLEIGVVSKKTHRTWNNATTATGLVLFTTASSQLWFSITLHLVVMSVCLEWQCKFYRNPWERQCYHYQKGLQSFAQIEMACRKGTVCNLPLLLSPLIFRCIQWAAFQISAFCVLNTKKQRSIEHYTIQYHMSQIESLEA